MPASVLIEPIDVELLPTWDEALCDGREPMGNPPTISSR
jgi:hypothetical protein